jgi:putative transposase
LPSPSIVDNFTRESLCTKVDFRFKGIDVANALEEVVAMYGDPEIIKVDNGPEFISKEVDLWAYSMESNSTFLDHGNPRIMPL